MARDYGGGGQQLNAQGQFVDLDSQIDAELSKQKSVRAAAAQQKTIFRFSTESSKRGSKLNTIGSRNWLAV